MRKVENILSQALGPDASALASEEKRALLARLLARLAHEVRNPLSSLDIHVQLLQEDLAQPDAAIREQMARRLSIIRGELKRLEEIVESFLRLSGPSELALEDVKVDRLLRRVIELVEPEASARQIRLEVLQPESLPALRADGSQLTQALLNVVLNALQAVDRKGLVRLTVRVADRDGVRIEVADSGPGVAKESRTAIFEPYFTTKDDGTGLGLWIAQQIVTAHGGSLSADNAADGGALFVFQLPWQASKASHGKIANPNLGRG